MRQAKVRTVAIIAITCFAVCALLPVGVAGKPTATSPANMEQPNFGMFAKDGSDQRNFILEIKPGETQSVAVGIVNAGKAPVALRTYAANAFSVPNGGFGAGAEDDAPLAPTQWLQYPAETITLKPGEEQDRSFKITVPNNTAPGQYVVALLVQTNESLPIPGTTTFRQIIRKAMKVIITVPGPVTPGFKLGAPHFSAGTSVRTLVIPISNTGNTLVQPEGSLVVTTVAGKTVVTSPIKMGDVFGGMSTTIELSIPDQFPAGDYLISLDLKDPATGASASIKNAKTTFAPPKAPSTPAAKQVPPFLVDQASVTPSGNPIQYADVAATVTNNGQLIPTANVTLDVKRDGKDVEQYALAQNQALPNGQTKISQRYIPKDGWKPGKWTFQIVVSAVSIGTGTQTVLATVDVPGAITIP